MDLRRVVLGLRHVVLDERAPLEHCDLRRAGPDVHAHEVSADRPTLALAAALAGQCLLVELDRAVAEVGRDRLAAPRPVPLPRPRPPRRRRRRAGVSAVVALSASSTGRVGAGIVSPIWGLRGTSTRSATSGSWICPSNGRSGSSGSASSTSSSARATVRAVGIANADGCGHRGCRGGASCERATLRRLTLRPLTLYRPTPGRATQQAAPASQARRRRSASVRTSGGSLLMKHAPSRAARPSRRMGAAPIARHRARSIDACAGRARLRRWATPHRPARPGAEPAVGLPARRRT